MIRADIISIVGRDYLQSNIENDEFSYQRGLGGIGKDYREFLMPNAQRQYRDVDLRFVDGNLTILIETKQRLVESRSEDDMEQLQQYVIYEKELTGNRVVAILAGTVSDEIRVWQDGSDIIDDEREDTDERTGNANKRTSHVIDAHSS